ncbi:HAMP domain-containing sensor histidine kinase [Bryocella elongata]|uniref:HAMP domain-containing sensor histidine kinase n=1 Tax=Bryocella elongata TaxID=863522 RepID=UPI001F4849E1|nr:HAMP domain-containing sensor histidine kinase [Bryocella elongata]
MAKDIQRRSDTWLSGEVEVLGDVAGITPKDRLYDKVVREVAELASREVPNRDHSAGNGSDSVFFLQVGTDGRDALWVGSEDRASAFAAIQSVPTRGDSPYDVRIKGFGTPFRVATIQVADGSHIYLGLSERDELRVLRNLRLRFLALWLVIVLLGFLVVFYATWRMLRKVDNIAVVAAHIGRADLSSRVPAPGGNGEIGRLARTLNQMLDHIEATVGQLHTITDALAHDLRSPLTAIRGKLEAALLPGASTDPTERIVSAIEELDRLSDFLNTSLDVSEAKADALRVSRAEIDLASLVRAIADFFEPSFSERGCSLQIRIMEPILISADAALLHRVIANLLDNELKHLPPSRTVWVSVQAAQDVALFIVEDDGPGFDPDVLPHLFERRVKGKSSRGHGLGLAFVQAVVRVHGGSVEAINRAGGGIRISVSLPSADASGAIKHPVDALVSQ